MWVTRGGVGVWVLTSLIACAACGGGLLERAAGWYVTRKIDGLCDLGDEQRAWVRERVDHHLRVLRARELEPSLALLRRTRQVMQRGATSEDIGALQDGFDALMDRLVHHMIPDTAALLAGLREAQVEHLRDELLEALAERYEELGLPPAERRARVRDELFERIEEVVGPLRPAQRARFSPVARALADERAVHYLSGRRRVRDFARQLERRPGAGQIQATLRALWDGRFHAIGVASRAARRAEQRAFLLALDRSLDDSQRAHAVAYMDRRIARLERLRRR